MGRRSLAHLTGARNLGHPIEGRQRKRRSLKPKENCSSEPTLPVSAKNYEAAYLSVNTQYFTQLPIQEKPPVDAALQPSAHRDDWRSPTVAAAQYAIADIHTLLHPKRQTGYGHKMNALQPFVTKRLQQILIFLRVYVHGTQEWMKSSLVAVKFLGHGSYFAKRLRRWSRAFILDRSKLPDKQLSSGSISRLQDEDIESDANTHLQSLGKYVSAMDLVRYFQQDGVRQRYGFTISLATARRWMRRMGMRWMKTPKGQYVDGHERPDVVDYRQNNYIPRRFGSKLPLRTWTAGTIGDRVVPSSSERHTVYWYQDETTFTQNDRRQVRWVTRGEKPIPQPKGEGSSLMVADFVSADYGWLRSPDGKEEARVLFKAGINRDGYFTNQEILDQATRAMDILEKYFPYDQHTLVYDNARTHLKRAPGALSARQMVLNIPKPGRNWLVEVPELNAEGQQVYAPDGTKLKKRVQMAPGTLPNGEPQSLYFPEGHPRAGIFKGMSTILQERGFSKEASLKRECPNFKCPPGGVDCCARRFLYNQPDFVGVETLLEIHCKKRGFEVLFLPKFHPELSPIEPCWGSAKRSYRELPLSHSEGELETNVLVSLESVSLEEIRR